MLLELEAGADPAADRTQAIRAALGPDVAPTLRRTVVVGEDDIPFGPTGKVRKFALRERYLATQAVTHGAAEGAGR